MLRLDPSIIPDPFKPAADDAYGPAPSMSQLVVLKAYETNAGEHHVHFVVRGDFKICDVSLFEPMLASLNFVPTGRMTSEPLPVGPRIEPSEAFHAHVEPGSFHEGVLVGRREALDPVDGGLMEPEHRRLARMFGPILRMAREKHRVRLGELARALGCQTAALSAFELGERPGDKQPAGTSEMEASPRKRSRYDVTGEPLLQPPAQMTVMRLSGRETSWYTAHKTGYVDFNDADYIVEAGERYRVHEGRFEIEATKPARAPVDNVAIETGRDVLAAALAKAVWLAQDSRHEAAMLRSDEYATIHTAIHDALKEPEAREGFKLYADGLAPDEPGPDPATLASGIANPLGFEIVLWTTDTGGKFSPVASETLADSIRRAIETAPFMRMQVQAGLVAEAVRVLGLIDGKDPHHDGEALQQALAILRQVAP